MKKEFHIGHLAIGVHPLVVGVVSSCRTLEHPLDLNNLPFDVAELRVDLIGVDCPYWLEQANKIMAAGTPVLLTVRHPDEGGHWYLNEQERKDVYHTAISFVSAIDVEIGSEIIHDLALEARKAGRLVIGSFHDFEKTPDEKTLRAKILDGKKKGADVVKLATMIRSPADIATLRGLLADEELGPLCLLGMGEGGAETRVSLAAEGSCLTYGFFDQASAPGQISSAELRKRLIAASPAYMDFSNHWKKTA